MAQIAIIIGVVLVVIARRFSTIAGGALALALVLGIGIWGYSELARGAHLALGGFPISKGMFVTGLAAWAGLETWMLIRAVRTRPQRRPDDEP